METRKETRLWPFDRCLNTSDFSYAGSLPPTVEDVLFNFRSRHKHHQLETSRQSSLKDSAKETVAEVQKWWIRPGYKCKRGHELVLDILNYDKRWKQLTQDHNKIVNGTKNSFNSIICTGYVLEKALE